MYTNKSLMRPQSPKDPLSSEQLIDNTTMIFLATVSFITCFGLFQSLNKQAFLHLPTEPIAEVSGRVVSMIQSIFLLALSTLYLTKKVRWTTWHKSLSISVGYLIFDLSRHFFAEPINFKGILEPAIHHILLLVIILNYVYKYPNLLAVGLFSEITNFFVYPCWFLYKRGDVDTILFKILALSGLVLYAIFRVYNFGRILYQLYKRKAFYIELLGFSLVVGINYYWFIRLLQKFFAH